VQTACQRGISAAAAGIPLFFCVAAGRAQLPLARELLEEQDWPAARRKAQRVLQRQPDHAAARLMAALAGMRLDPSSEPALLALEAAARHAALPADLRPPAAEEIGAARARRGEDAAAYPWLKEAFLASAAAPAFGRRAALLAALLERNPALAAADPALALQAAAAAARAAPAPDAPPRPPSWAARFAEAIVAGYRCGVAPAIGHRCSLDPSCSEYFRQAGRRHGWLALPLIADRLVREPGVVAQGRKPVAAAGAVRYADPLADHYPEGPAP